MDAPTSKLIQVFPDAQAVSRAGADQFLRRALEATGARGRFMVALSGGSTPKSLYSLLATEPSFREKLPWPAIHFFFGDERHVPPDHLDSNYRMAAESMLSKVPIPPQNVHRILAENPNAQDAARLYEEELRAAFQGELPRFDLLLLGLGPDGHTASLFPGTAAIHESTRWVAAPWVEKFQAFRITLTPVVLNHASHVVFLVTGGDKADALREVLEGSAPVGQFPAKVVRPVAGTLSWLVDAAAAAKLRG